MASVLAPQDQRAFQVDCSATPVGSFRAGADLVSVAIGQRISRLEGEEMWESVVVRCKEEGNELCVEVLVFHPEWDKPLQIACVRSHRRIVGQGQGGEPLRVSLDHVPV
jgi:hypothetical protein